MIRSFTFIFFIACLLFTQSSSAQSGTEDFELTDMTVEQLDGLKQYAAWGEQLVRYYLDLDEGEIDFHHVDKAIVVWRESKDPEKEGAEDLIDGFGALLGELLIDKLGLEWKFHTDVHGTDYAVLDQAIRVSAFPFASARRSIENNQEHSFEEIYEILKRQLE